jgi:hypothetical protein
MATKKQISTTLQSRELAFIIKWLTDNHLYGRFKKELGLDPKKKVGDSGQLYNMEKCLKSFYECSHYVEYRKKHLKQYLWLRRNNLLKEFQKKINYTKSQSVTHASKYRGRNSISYCKCIKDWNEGRFKYKSDYYRCFSGNFKYLQRNNLLDKFLAEVLIK